MAMPVSLDDLPDLDATPSGGAVDFDSLPDLDAEPAARPHKTPNLPAPMSFDDLPDLDALVDAPNPGSLPLLAQGGADLKLPQAAIDYMAGQDKVFAAQEAERQAALPPQPSAGEAGLGLATSVASSVAGPFDPTFIPGKVAEGYNVIKSTVDPDIAGERAGSLLDPTAPKPGPEIDLSAGEEFKRYLGRATHGQLQQMQTAAQHTLAPILAPDGGAAMMSDDASRELAKVQQQYQRSTNLGALGNVAMDVADVAPQLAVQIAASYTGLGKLGFVGAAVAPVYAQSLNDTFDLVRSNGGDYATAWEAAQRVAITNAIVTGITSRAEFAILQKSSVAKNLLTRFGINRLKMFGAEALQEGTEQVGQEMMDALIRAENDISGVPFEKRLNNALYAGMVGGLAGAAMPMPKVSPEADRHLRKIDRSIRAEEVESNHAKAAALARSKGDEEAAAIIENQRVEKLQELTAEELADIKLAEKQQQVAEKEAKLAEKNAPPIETNPVQTPQVDTEPVTVPQVDTPATTTDVATNAASMFVEYQGKQLPIESFEDASQKFSQMRDAFTDATGGGNSALSEAGLWPLLIKDSNGNVIANISYNGRVWKGPPSIKSELLFDPSKAKYAPQPAVGVSGEPVAGEGVVEDDADAAAAATPIAPAVPPAAEPVAAGVEAAAGDAGEVATPSTRKQAIEQLSKEQQAEVAELDDLHYKSVAMQGPEKGYKPYKLTQKQKDRYKELMQKYRHLYWQTVSPATDELLGTNERGEPIYWSADAKTHYSLVNGRVNTGPWTEGLSEAATERLLALYEVEPESTDLAAPQPPAPAPVETEAVQQPTATAAPTPVPPTEASTQQADNDSPATEAAAQPGPRTPPKTARFAKSNLDDIIRAELPTGAHRWLFAESRDARDTSGMSLAERIETFLDDTAEQSARGDTDEAGTDYGRLAMRVLLMQKRGELLGYQTGKMVSVPASELREGDTFRIGPNIATVTGSFEDGSATIELKRGTAAQNLLHPELVSTDTFSIPGDKAVPMNEGSLKLVKVPKPPKPVEPRPTAEDGSKLTATQNSVTAAIRREHGLHEKPPAEREPLEAALVYALENNMHTKEAVAKVNDRVINGDYKHMSPAEQMAADHRIITIEKRINEIVKEIAPAGPVEARTLSAERDALRAEIDEITSATIIAGTAWGREGVARRMALGEDYSLAGLITRAKKVNDGKMKNAAYEAKINEMAARIAELEAQAAKMAKARKARVAQAVAGEAKTRNTKSRAELEAEAQTIESRLAELISGGCASI